MAFRKGGAAAKAADKAKRPTFDRAEFLKLEADGDKIVLRFIDDHDEWIFVDQHSYIPTRGPARDWDQDRKDRYPAKNGAVCRKDEAFNDDEGKSKFDDCFICDHMKKSDGKSYGAPIRVWARALVMDPVLGTQAMVDAGKITARKVDKPVGYKVAMIEVEQTGDDGKATGKKIRKPRVVVANFGLKNFFAALQGYATANEGTICDRDYQIVRDGIDKDTNYTIMERPETPDFDLSDPETKAKYLKDAPNLEELIEYRASDEYYAQYFDTRVPHPERKGDSSDDDADDAEEQRPTRKPAASKAPSRAQEDDGDDGDDEGGSNGSGGGAVDADALKAMTDRVRGRSKRPAAPVEDPEDESADADDPEYAGV